MVSKIIVPLLVILILCIVLLSLNSGKNQEIISPLSESSVNIDYEVKSKVEITPEPINISKIFDNKNESESYKNNPKLWTLMATGDVMLGRMINYNSNLNNDYNWAFTNVNKFLNTADLTFINLESPMNKDCPPTKSGMIFCAGEKTMEGMTKSGIDLASFANNHALNQGTDGVVFTKEILNKNGILDVGIKNPTYKTVNGVKAAFLGYDDVECYKESIECVDFDNIKSDIAEAKANADVVIIMYSWGTEYTYEPTSRQIETAYFSIDNGADLVLGNHPHWYQPVEIYKNKLISYSHGNFIFDQMWSEETKEGLAGKYTFLGNELIDVEFTPIVIKDYGQAHIADESDKNRILNNLENISTELIN